MLQVLRARGYARATTDSEVIDEPSWQLYWRLGFKKERRVEAWVKPLLEISSIITSWRIATSDVQKEGSVLVSSVLFDLGGTLVEEASNALDAEQWSYDRQVRAIHQSLEREGIIINWSLFKKRYEQVRARQIERSLKTLREYSMLRRVSNTLGFFGYDISPASDAIRKAVDANMDVYIGSLRIEKSAPDLLEELNSRYKLGLVTNFAYHPAVYQILDRLDLAMYFEAVVISGEVGWRKPSRYIFEAALSKLSASPEEAVFVGDEYETDILGAKKIGMRAILLDRENTDSEEADMSITSLDELPPSLERILTIT